MTVRIELDPVTPDEDGVETAAAIVRRGGVVAFPTETLYGLAADATSEPAVARVFEIKGRAPGVAIPVIAADRAQVERWVGTLTDAGVRLADAFWPGPLTLVIRAAPGLPPALLGGGDTVAVRISSHRVAQALARAAGRPITATSANRSGHEPTALPAVVVRDIGSAIDAIVDAGPCAGGAPSTIVDVTGGAPRLVRAGAVPWDRVLHSLHG
jgi:L-threonylcarbamoyladenylate synthase